jgi:endonuclease/exonuclease/phosphatase (EEP) superfamily protein YafD
MVLTGYLAVLFAGWFPLDFRDVSVGHSAAAWIALIIRNFMFHIGALIGIVALLALIGRCVGLAICSIPLILFCLGEELGDLRNKPARPAAGETISVMSFSLYGPKRDGTGTDPAAVLAEIQAASPEVLFLQEFTGDWNAALHPTLVEQGYRYHRRIVRDDPLGTAIYSRRTFEEGEERQSGIFVSLAGQKQVRAVVRLDDRPVALYSVCLLPPLRSDRASFCRVQFADLRDRLTTETLPAIVAGGLSFTRRTHQGRALKSLKYEDAHRWVGKGRGGTWPASPKAPWMPLLQLDHIYLSSQLVCTECRTGEPAGSDHLPVIARVGFSTTASDSTTPPGIKSDETPSELPKTDLAEASSATDSKSETAPTPSEESLKNSPRSERLPLELPARGATERPPWRSPVSPADGGPPPRREPWSAVDDPPERSPDAPPPRSPGKSP